MQKPGFLLVSIVQLVRLGQMLADFAHALRKRSYVLEQNWAFEVLHDLVAISDGVDITQRGVKERRQIVLFFFGRDGGYDLIEIEVAEKLGRVGRFFFEAIVGASKQYAAEDPGKCIVRSGFPG